MKRCCKLTVLISLLLVFAQGAVAQIITTYAGKGTTGYTGDGGPATDAEFNHPEGIAIDSNGLSSETTLFIADVYNHCIRKITPYGVISTVAGLGMPGFNGDGVPAITAQLTTPRGIATDRAGNIYIADDGNARLRKIDKLGMISTIAGTGSPGYTGDGGASSAAKLYNISDVVVDTTGNIFFVDPFENCVRKINTSRVITTFAGGGAVGFSGDGGPASMAKLNGVTSIAVDLAGNVYIADVQNYRIRKVDLTGLITTIAGTGIMGFSGDNSPATAANIGAIAGVAADATGNVYITETAEGRVRKIDGLGVITTIAGDGTACGFGGDGSLAVNAKLCNPYRIVVDKRGSLYFTDKGNQRIRKIMYTTGVHELQSRVKEVTISPNPATDDHLELMVTTNNTEIVRVKLCTITGILVKEFSATTNELTPLNFSGTPPGMYFISVVAGPEVWSGRVIIQ